MKLIKTKNYKSMSKIAADYLIKEVNKKPNLTIGLATGSTFLGFYKNLVKAYKKGEVDFSKVKTFNLDEYYPIKKSDKNSYYYYMYKNLFNKVNIKSSNINLLNGEAKNPYLECKKYEQKIKNNPLDVQFLGIGVNAHIGFNEPYSSPKSRTRLVKLSSQTKKSNSRFFFKRKFPNQALTVGIKTINSAKQIILLASGKKKSNAIKCLLQKPSKSCPVSYLKKEKLTLIADKEAVNPIKSKA